VKPCKICNEPKTWHYGWRIDYPDHKFEMDNLAYLEKRVLAKELVDKHKKLNFCLICKQDKKSPFGICKECSERLIQEKV
jgi:hypothetical protein